MTGAIPTGVVLIGMAGAGKSVVGRALAERWGRPWVDTDTVLETMFGATLQTLLERFGLDGFKRLEQFAILHTDWTPGAVVATGGSVIYSPPALAALRRVGPVVYLRVSLVTVLSRVGNWDQRGFIKQPGQTLADVYVERAALYQAAADLILTSDDRPPAELAAELEAILGAH